MKRFITGCLWNAIAVTIGLMASDIWNCGFYKTAVLIVVAFVAFIFWPVIKNIFGFEQFKHGRRV